MMEGQVAKKGLEGVIADTSRICSIDGEAGRLSYWGYPIEELAEKSCFEECVHLLISGELPTPAELALVQRDLKRHRRLPRPVIEMIHAFPEDGHPMELLQMATVSLGAHDVPTTENPIHCRCKKPLYLVAQIPTVVAYFCRRLQGLAPVPPRDDLDHATNFLFMLRGKLPSPLEAQILDAMQILHMEHGFNASTFTARVIASSLACCYSAVSGAIGSLYGPLHGGATEEVLDMIDEIRSPENVNAWLARTLEKHGKVYGFGHRVYKTLDPRVPILQRLLHQVSLESGDGITVNIIERLRESLRREMDKQGKPIYPNVDLYTGVLYGNLGISDRQFFPALFTMARVVGWLAHIREQREDNRIYRPDAAYVGPSNRHYIPMEARDGGGRLSFTATGEEAAVPRAAKTR